MLLVAHFRLRNMRWTYTKSTNIEITISLISGSAQNTRFVYLLVRIEILVHRWLRLSRDDLSTIEIIFSRRIRGWWVISLRLLLINSNFVFGHG